MDLRRPVLGEANANTTLSMLTDVRDNKYVVVPLEKVPYHWHAYGASASVVTENAAQTALIPAPRA